MAEVAAIYQECASNCADHGSKLVALLEGGQLWQWLAAQAVNSGSEAIPNSFREEPQLRQAFLGALNEAVRPVWEASRELLAKCAETSKENAIVVQCRDAIRKIPIFNTEAKSLGESGRACTPKTVAAVKSSAPCTFSGGLFAELDFYSDERGGSPIMVSDDRLPMNAAQIELATKTDSRIRFIMNEPVKFNGWVTARKGLVTLRQGVEIVHKHVWLSSEQPLHAHQANGRVHVSQTFGWGSGTRPQTWSGDVDCRDVTLVGLTTQQANAGEPRLLAAGIVNMYDAALGNVIGAIDGSGWTRIWLQQTLPEWSHVTGKVPFMFDAWIRTKDISTEKPFGIGMPSPQCSHATRNPLPLRLDGDLSAPVVGVLPAAGEFRVDAGSTSEKFVAIEVPGIRPANKLSRFFVNRELFNTATSPLG